MRNEKGQLLKGNTNGFKKGIVPWNKNTKGVMKPNQTSFKNGFTPWNKGEKGLQPRHNISGLNPTYWLGKKRPEVKNFKGFGFKKGVIPWNKGVGNKTSEAKKIRSSLEYRLWRKSVYERDNYTCVWCFKRGGKLHADHIKPFALYPELRLEVNNGRTLCISCHKKTGTYGRKSMYRNSLIVINN